MYVADPSAEPEGIFAYTLHPTRVEMLTEGPTAEELGAVGAHWAHSQELLAGGVIVFAGRTMIVTAETFAIIVFRAASPEAAQAIALSDPAVQAGVFRSVLYPFQPMLMGPWPAEARLQAE